MFTANDNEIVCIDLSNRNGHLLSLSIIKQFK